MVIKALDTIEKSQENGGMRNQSPITIDLSHLKILIKTILMKMILMTKMISNLLELHTTKRSIQLSSGAIMVASMEVTMASIEVIMASMEVIMASITDKRMDITCLSLLTNLIEEVKMLIHTRSGSTLSHICPKILLRCKLSNSGILSLLPVPSGVPFFS